MSELLPWVAAAVLWVALAYQLGVTRRRGLSDQVPSWLAFAFASLAVALTLNLPPVYVAFDRVVGEPNLGELIVHALVLLAGWAAQGAIVHFRHERPAANIKIKRRGFVLVAALGA